MAIRRRSPIKGLFHVRCGYLSYTLFLVLPLTAAGQRPSEPLAPQRPGSGARISLESCRLDGLQEEVRCGSYEVYEDRDARKGRRIGLKIAVLPALGPTPARDPLFFIGGGPGQAATKMADSAVEIFKGIRHDRDIVLVDVRGTGSSNPLNCDLYGNDVQAHFGDLFPSTQVQACRDQLQQHADLRLYTTTFAMDDLDEVRQALGYDRINIYGTSYGTWAAQVYMGRHAAHVRSVILKAIASVQSAASAGLLTYARDAQRALDRLFDDCAADAACVAAFPKLRDEFQAILGRFAGGSVRVQLTPPSVPKSLEVEITRGAFTGTLLTALQSTSTTSQIPLLLHRAFEGDFGPMAQGIYAARHLGQQQLSFGLHFSVMCTEANPDLDSKVVARESEGTFLGDYRLQQLKQACREWPRGKVPAGFGQPVRWDAPTLLLSGSLDPNTPPRFGEEVARHLPNSRHVILSNVAHSLSGSAGCADRFMAEFIAQGTLEGLDVSCAEKIRRRPFVLLP